MPNLKHSELVHSLTRRSYLAAFITCSRCWGLTHLTSPASPSLVCSGRWSQLHQKTMPTCSQDVATGKIPLQKQYPPLPWVAPIRGNKPSMINPMPSQARLPPTTKASNKNDMKIYQLCLSNRFLWTNNPKNSSITTNEIMNHVSQPPGFLSNVVQMRVLELTMLVEAKTNGFPHEFGHLRRHFPCG